MNKTFLKRIFFTFLLVYLLFSFLSCAGNHPGQTYPDAPDSFWADDGPISTGNSQVELGQIYTVGFDMMNKGKSPLILDAFAAVASPKQITTVATAISNPDENDKSLIEPGNFGYPPILPTLHRPYIFHPLHRAIIHPNEYVEAIIALKNSARGAFIIQGFLLTLEIDGQTYQHYYREAVVLCVEVDKQTCDKAFETADERVNPQQKNN
jgi:hypothetical protein